MKKIIVTNAQKMNYDQLLDFSSLGESVEIYDHSTTEELLERAKGAYCLVTKELPVPASIVEQLPESVELIVEAGTGYNNIDIEAAKQRNITVCNIPAYSSERVAHTAIMFLLNLSSTMQEQIAMLAKGDRRNFTEHLLVPHVEVNGKTIGLIGCGGIGEQVKKVALALGMKVLIYKRSPDKDSEDVRYVSLEELLKNSDYISLHCPLTADTKHIINEEALALMKESAFLINTSRGPLVDETALIRALQEKHIAGAGLDVQEVEPPVEYNPLYTLPNVIMTPHMGWKGLETRQRLVSIVKANIQNYDAGTPINVVNA